MPRPAVTPVQLDATPATMRAVVGDGGLNARAAMQAVVTWASSATRREDLLDRSEFPLAGDMLAFLVMNQLAYRGVARPTELADAAHTGRSNLSKVVRRLEAAGLVGRMANPADGRETMIGMTSEGREVARRIVAASDMDLAGALADWSADDRVRFEALLVRLVRDLDRQVDGDVHRIAGGTWEDAATPWRPGDAP
ncbi:MarR family transcriptional regulator [Microbacterium laevaniformans]|uniref:MarR family transcriptional regulator n=1 Tax=Microbacterium laevaniformans TaxID=36807 RepID=A0A4S2D458_9MICO|nr:MarR family transcriptional regulator [Microbacterium laevaniformans]TGY36279.1 MarR family transcriptional regulator [Microbacterium laevaniformans]